MEVDIEDVVRIGRETSQCIKPVLESAEGSGKYKHAGSAFVLSMERRAAIVTARHVIDSNKNTKFVIVSPNKGTLRWPSKYAVVEPINETVADADLAYVTGDLSEDAAARPATIPLARFAPGLVVKPGDSFIAMGFPKSRARLHMAEAHFSSQMFFATCRAEPVSTYERLRLDRNVHLAVSYNRKNGRLIDGQPRTGSDPHGMSGGLLFLPTILSEGIEASAVLFAAGVLVRYFASPENVLVATRIDCLTDALAPGRDGALRTHRKAKSDAYR